MDMKTVTQIRIRQRMNRVATVCLQNHGLTVTRPEITKDRFSHVMAFPGQATVDDEVRESGSTLIAIIINLKC